MIENFLEAVIFRSRWLLAPFFIGLVFSILLLLIKFLEELFHLSTHIFLFTENDVIVAILALVDIALVGSLLLMIIFSGY